MTQVLVEDLQAPAPDRGRWHYSIQLTWLIRLILCYDTTANNGSLCVRYAHYLCIDHAKLCILIVQWFLARPKTTPPTKYLKMWLKNSVWPADERDTCLILTETRQWCVGVNQLFELYTRQWALICDLHSCHCQCRDNSLPLNMFPGRRMMACLFVQWWTSSGTAAHSAVAFLRIWRRLQLL